MNAVIAFGVFILRFFVNVQTLRSDPHQFSATFRMIVWGMDPFGLSAILKSLFGGRFGKTWYKFTTLGKILTIYHTRFGNLQHLARQFTAFGKTLAIYSIMQNLATDNIRQLTTFGKPLAIFNIRQDCNTRQDLDNFVFRQPINNIRQKRCGN